MQSSCSKGSGGSDIKKGEFSSDLKAVEKRKWADICIKSTNVENLELYNSAHPVKESRFYLSNYYLAYEHLVF